MPRLIKTLAHLRRVKQSLRGLKQRLNNATRERAIREFKNTGAITISTAIGLNTLLSKEEKAALFAEHKGLGKAYVTTLKQNSPF